MNVVASSLVVALWTLSQAQAPASAPPPAAADAAAMPPAAAPASAAPPASDPAAPPPADAQPTAAVADGSTTPADPRHWRTEKVPVAGGGQEVRVLRSDDTAVSLGEGLADIKQADRLQNRARKLDDSQTNWETILGRVAVIVAGGVLMTGGIVAGILGAGFWAWSRTALPESLPTQVTAVVLQGPSILATGIAMSAIGLFMVAATAGLWAYFIWRGPAPADPAVVQALAAQLAWDEKEAAEVVEKHNATVDGRPPQTTTEPAPAPAPSQPVEELEGSTSPAPQAAPADASPAPVAPAPAPAQPQP